MAKLAGNVLYFLVPLHKKRVRDTTGIHLRSSYVGNYYDYDYAICWNFSPVKSYTQVVVFLSCETARMSVRLLELQSEARRLFQPFARFALTGKGGGDCEPIFWSLEPE
jgi:hypothetical protein